MKVQDNFLGSYNTNRRKWKEFTQELLIYLLLLLMDVQWSGLYKQSELFSKHKVYSLIKSTKKL